MGLFNLFNKKSTDIKVKRDVITNNYLQILEQLKNNSQNKISAKQAIDYYNVVAPFADSVDIISEIFANVPTVLKDIETGEYITDHEVLSLLNKPNPDHTSTEFKKSLSAFYLITGNTYINAGGSFMSTPKELSIVNPTIVSATAGTDGYVKSYQVKNGSKSEVFTRRENVDGFYYVNQSELNQLYHIKDFNPVEANQNILGQSIVQSMIYEIKQYLTASIHNLSLLENGARLSGILMKEGYLTQEQRDHISQQFRENNSGAKNAATTLLLETGDGKMDYKEVSQTNKDMDFYQLKKDAKFMIYQKFGIPLPLVSPDHMTMSNYEEAQLALYRNAVLPIMDMLNTELTKFLMGRYKDGYKYKICYNPKDIPVLEESNNIEIERKQKIGIFTINELRQMYGQEPLTGGDVLYQPLNLVPLGSSDDVVPEAEKIKTILKRNDL